MLDLPMSEPNPSKAEINTVQITTQPDIEYHPNYEKYVRRRAHRLIEQPNLPETPLPEGFPQQLRGPIVWEGDDWENEAQWVYTLSEDELKEINDALAHFQRRCTSILRHARH